MTPRHVEARGEALAEQIRRAGWRRIACVDLARGRWQRAFVSAHDPRITLLVEGGAGDREKRTFHFADDGVIEVDEITPPLIDDVGRDFDSLQALAEATVTHDDTRAWYAAAPGGREA